MIATNVKDTYIAKVYVFRVNLQTPLISAKDVLSMHLKTVSVSGVKN